MRAKVKIVGMGKRLSGTSKKTNNPYDFIPLSFIYQDKFTEGYKAETVNVDGEYVDDHGGIKVGDEVEFVFHVANNRTYVDAIL